MGVVFRAYDAEMAGEVALKALIHLTPSNLYHLKREFRTLAEIKHPNLVHLFELFSDGRTCFFTMELIVGTDLVRFVRNPSATLETRIQLLRDAARQLALAIAAVHAAHKLHRDVKPTNVMVTKSARVVLLDFGIAVPVPSETATRDERRNESFAGTLGYMPPEQLRCAVLTPAADWYAFGATLFQAATGHLPFDRPAQAFAKHSVAAHVRSHVPAFPEDLDALISDLLHWSPEERPATREILRRLNARSSTPIPSLRSGSDASDVDIFRGRTTELFELRGALARSREGQIVVAHVYGPSGIGKSELVRRFLAEVRDEDAVVLRSRCHPQESVAFNAIDGVVDDLGRFFLSTEDVAPVPMTPRDLDAIARVFPVLAHLEPRAGASQTSTEMSGAEALRRATRTFRDLLAYVASSQSLIVWIDDAQWGDEASGMLLREILGPQRLPSMLLVLTYRSEVSDSGHTLRAIANVHKGASGLVRTDIAVAPLSESDTVSLMRDLLGERFGALRQGFVSLARETEGLPFFVHELVKYIAASPSADDSVPSHLRLGDLLAARMRRLDPAALRVLQAVSVAGGPIEQRVLLRAAAVTDSERVSLTSLERDSLVRSVTLEGGRLTEVYHNRIRDEVLKRMPDDARRAQHRAIADAMLTSERPILTRVVEHYEAAGDEAGVRRYVVTAARDAAASLAFDLAESLYRRAIAIGGTDLEPVELHALLASVLAGSGRSKLAGEAFERAAELADGDTALRDRAPYLRRRAADQFLQGGHRNDAERMLKAVLEPLGVHLPGSRDEALRRTLTGRLSLLMRGLRYERRELADIPRDTLDRLDLLRTLSITFGFVDHTVAAWLGTRQLREALNVGEPAHIAEALFVDISLWAPLSGSFAQRRVAKMFALFDKLRTEAPSPRGEAQVSQCRGMIESFLGNFDAAAQHLARALELLRGIGNNVSFEISQCEVFRLPVLAELGRFRELREALEGDLVEAEERGDEFFIASCAAGPTSISWLAQDRPDEALRWAERVLRAAPEEYSSQHYFHLVGTAVAALYEGRFADACRMVEDAWPLLDRNYFLSLSWIRDELRYLRARSAIGMAATLARGGAGASIRSAERWLRLAQREARTLEGHGMAFGPPRAKVLRAGVCAVRGDGAGRLALLRQGAAEFHMAGLALHEHATRLVMGGLSSEAAERAAANKSRAWFDSQGVVNPDRLAALLVPGGPCSPAI